jgi:hypothetical protein
VAARLRLPAEADAPAGRRSMFASKLRRQLADPDSAPALIHRLMTEYAFGQWRRYAVAFALMAVAAAMTALGAYLIGDVINAAYVHKNLPAIVALAFVTAGIFWSRRCRVTAAR